MLWVIQKDVHARNQSYDLIEALERLNIDYIEVEVAKNKIKPDVEIGHNVQIITNGSIMLSNIAKEKGWSPGSLFNDNFSYNVWSKHYRDLLINKNAIVSKLKDAVINNDIFFSRSILDNKSFNVKVFTKEEFLEFQKNSINLKNGSPNPDIEILISQQKKIGQEHRHYIVNDEIVTSSRYKFNGQPNFKEGCDDNVLEVVQNAISRWQPARAFVLDTYISGDEIGIVEIGCICHAGIYNADLMKLVVALDSMKIEISIENKEKNKYKF